MASVVYLTKQQDTYPNLSSPLSSKRLSVEEKFARKRVHKIEDLRSLESRLSAASLRSRQRGFLQRAESYETQAEAVRSERERWEQLTLHSRPKKTTWTSTLYNLGHKFTTFISTFITTFITFLGSILFSSTPSQQVQEQSTFPKFSNFLSRWRSTPNHPEHWVTKIAQDELVKKGSRRADMYLRPVTT